MPWYVLEISVLKHLSMLAVLSSNLECASWANMPA